MTAGTDQLRIGFVGAGWVNGIHAASLAKIPGVSLTAVFNHNLERAEQFAREHCGGTAAAYNDLALMLDAERLDAVYVALPPGAHNGQVELVAGRGIHLMLEKPIALTIERAESIAKAVREGGGLCQIGFHMRHSAPVARLRGMIEDGTAGRPLFMQGHYFSNELYPAWWRDPTLGGGQLVEQSIHIYDLARYFLGEPSFVMAQADNLHHERFPDYRVDDVSASTIRFDSRAIASLCASNCAVPGTGSIVMRVQFENVAVEFSSPAEAVFVHHRGKVAEEIRDHPDQVVREVVSDGGSAYEELSANLIGAIRGTAVLRSGIDDGVESLRLVLAASESARSAGRPVAMGPTA